MATTPGLGIDRNLLPRLARSMTASLGVGEVLAAASRTAVELVPDSLVLVWVLHGDRLVLRGAAGVLDGVHAGLRTDLGFGEGLPGHVARSRQPLVVEDPADDPRTTQPEFLVAERVRWFVGLPLSARYALEGVLGIFSRAAEPPGPETVDALGALAAQAALAVESARLAAHGERRRREAEALAAVGQALAYSLNPQVVSQLIADSVIALLGASDGAVYRLEPATGDLVAVAFAGLHVDGMPLLLPRGVGLAGRAVLEGRSISTRDALEDPRVVFPPELRARFHRLALGAVMATPLLVNGQAIGALGVAAGRGATFDGEARRLLEAFADQAAIALNNARLFAAERSARADAEAAEQRFRGLVESIDGVVIEFDVGTRRVLFVSRQAEALLGYPLEGWTAEPDFWREHLHPEDRARVLAFTRAEAAAGRRHVQEYRMLTAAGREVWIRDSASLVREMAQPPRLRCLYVDVTERKRTEGLMAGEKRVLETIAAGESLPRVLDVLCRAVESQGDGMLCSILLVEGDRLAGGAAPSLPRQYVEAIDGLAIGPHAGSCGTAAFRRQPVIVEDVATDPLWEQHRGLALAHGLRACWSVPVLDTGGIPLATFAIYYPTPRRPGADDRRLIDRVARLAGIAIERVRAETALRESERRYRTLVTNIPDVAWLVDRAGNTLFISPNVEKIGGYTAEELYRAGSAGWFGRIHPDDLPMVHQHFDALFQGGAGAFDVEYRLRHRDGRWIWLHDRAVTTYEDHDTTYVYGLYSNITDRKQAEEIRALLLNQVITVQEEERRRIARELHDETAQSLASLLLGLSALQEARTLKATRDRARDLHGVATHALAEVRRLAWGLRPSVLDDLGLATALERYAEEFGRTRGITVALQTAGLEEARMPAAVETALYRIMQEALSNVARHAGARRVGVQLQRHGATVALVVEDDGQGFDPAQPPAPSTAARGLGIHSMRERAAVHKGALAIDSAPGRGTRVAVEIPLTMEHA